METMKTEQEVREMYLNEPWGKLLAEMGWDPYNTESRARDVAQFAADRIKELESKIKSLEDELIEEGDY